MNKTLILSLSFLALLACDPRVFDDIEDLTYVNTHGAPENADDYAIAMVAGGGDELHAVVVAGNPPTTVRVKYNKSGSLDTVVDKIRNTVDNAANLESPVLASDPSSFGMEFGNVAIATLDDGTSALHTMRADSGEPTAPIFLSGDAPATGIAFGDSDVSVGTIDLVAVSGNELHLIQDYQSSRAIIRCALGGTGGSVFLADLGGTPGDEIIVVVDGELQVTQASIIVAANGDPEDPNDNVGCFDVDNASQGLETAPGGEASFGSKILVGHFDSDSDNKNDLLVTAPDESAVYLYLNWTVGDQTPAVKLPTPSGTKRFGHDVAVGDFDIDGRDEIVVSDPQQTIASHDLAGRTFIFSTDDSGAILNAPIVLHDARAEDKQVFGQSLTVDSAFGEDSLVVGAKAEVFTYFRTPVIDDDDFRE